MPRLRSFLDRYRSGGDGAPDRTAVLEAQCAELLSLAAEGQAEVAALRHAVADLQASQDRHLRIATAGYDDLPRLREQLRAVRRSPGYALALADPHPLVSVPIATYNRPDLLVERAIASVRAQTYDQWEIVVVGDGCEDNETARRIAKLGDERIRFAALPFRTVLGTAEADRWLVSGTRPWNRAVELCRGTWLAPLDDDDEFLPHHLETLLALARQEQVELAYGRMERVGAFGADQYIFSKPPALGGIGMQQMIYLSALDFFECDPYSWVLGEPVDWNCVRRMLAAGVLMAATDVLVSRYYPSNILAG